MMTFQEQQMQIGHTEPSLLATCCQGPPAEQ